MDSHRWEADLRAIRAGTAPRQELFVRYRVVTPLSELGRQDLGEPDREGWLHAFEDEACVHPIARIRVGADLTLPRELGRTTIVGWPAPGRAFQLADGSARALGPAYELRPSVRISRWWGLVLLTPVLLVLSWIPLFGIASLRPGSDITADLVYGFLLRVVLPIGAALAIWWRSRREDPR